MPALPAFLGHRWFRLGIAAAVLLAGLVFLLRNALFGPVVDVYEVRRGDLAQTVVATGRITTPQRVAVSSVVTERVVRIPVAEGQQVHRGDVLLVLDDKDEQAAVAQAESAVAAAEARLAQLRDVAVLAAEQALVQAEANQLLARTQFQRNTDLAAKGFMSKSALDDAKRNVDVTDSQVKAAQLALAANRPGGGEHRLAVTALALAQASLTAARARLADTVVRAPADGILIGRSVEPGDVVQPGRELMALAPAGETQVVVQIDERNLARLAAGQKALVSADAYPGQRFPAELFYINPGVDAQRGAVEVKLRVPSPPAYLRQDMTVSVDIDVGRRTGVPVVPAAAIVDLAGEHPYVLAVEHGRAVKKPVTLGLRGNGSVEIVAGVAPGTLVVANTTGIGDGDRVRTGAVQGP
ncbi:MAG: efflux RND transporter periplasmic adaptor subunit [Burkholderiales bacterium]